MNTTIKWIRHGIGAASFGTLALIFLLMTCFGRNDLHTWQIVQHVTGTVTVRNDPGWYWAPFARVTTYPESFAVYATRTEMQFSRGNESVKARFNDGGTADISWYTRVATPRAFEVETKEERAAIEEHQRTFHRQFTGNVEGARTAVRSFARNVVTQTGPIMSSSENQSARKAEFWEECHGQLRSGLYKMQPVKIKRDTGVSEMLNAVSQGAKPEPANGEQGDTPVRAEDRVRDPGTVLTERRIEASETVVAAEIQRDDSGKPIVVTESPLLRYHMPVFQFAIAETEYDPGTQARFKEKKGDYLQAELSKAAAIESIQQRFLRVAQGDREVAVTEWKTELERERDTLMAELRQEVEERIKEKRRVEAETEALVAEVTEQEEDLLRQIAEIKAQIAENDKKADTIAATAREQELTIGGALSDHESTLLKIKVEEAKEVGVALEKLPVPDIVIMTPDALDPSKGTAMEQALPGLRLLKLYGLLDEDPFEVAPRQAPGTGDITVRPSPAVTDNVNK